MLSSYPSILKCSHGGSKVQLKLKTTGVYIPGDMESVMDAESKGRSVRIRQSLEM